MTLSIKNGGYAFLIRLDLMLSLSFVKIIVQIVKNFKEALH